MKTGLEHLPSTKRRELELVVEILFAEFKDAIVLGTQAHKRLGRILKIILYGSRARGEGVDDPIGGYVSDIGLRRHAAIPVLHHPMPLRPRRQPLPLRRCPAPPASP